MSRQFTVSALILFAALCFPAGRAYAQPSGWEDKGEYKEQKLKLPNLRAIRFTEDGSYFRTLHGNDTVCTWHTKTGQLLDMFVVPEAKNHPYLSKDGMTICYYSFVNNYICDSLVIIIRVTDISKKTDIAIDTLTAPGDIVCQLPYIGSNNGWINLVYGLTLLDYNYKGQFLICGTTFEYYHSENLFQQTYLYYTTCGGLAKFKVSNGKFTRSAVLSTITSNDFIETPQANFLTSLSKEKNEDVTGSVRSKFTTYNFLLSKHDLIKDSTLLLLSYLYSLATLSYGYTTETHISGLYRPLNRLIFSINTDNLYVKTDNMYLIISSGTNSLTDTLALLSLNGFEDLSYDGSKFYYIFNNKIIEHDIASKTILDSVPSPFQVNNMALVPNGGGLIITSINGDIAYYKSLNRSPEFKELTWLDRGAYKENAIQIPGLQAIAFSPDSSIFYTLHNNNVVYYWDRITGKLFDSLIFIEDNIRCSFSSDGKSMQYYEHYRRVLKNLVIPVKIVDLKTKSIISSYSLKIPDDFDIPLPEDTYEHFKWGQLNDVYFTILDYNFDNKQLKAAFEYKLESTSSSIITVEVNRSKLFGGSAIFNVMPDTMIRIQKTTVDPTKSLLYLGNKAYKTLFRSVYETVRDSDLSYESGNSYEFILNKTDFTSNNGLDLKKGGYHNISIWSKYFGTKIDSGGVYRPFTTLLHDSTNNRLYMKADSLYYIFDLATDEQIDSIALPGKNCLEAFNKNFSKVIYFFNGKIYSKSVPYDYLIDSLDCPFVPNTLSLVPNSEDIALTSDSGRIIIFKKFNTIPSRPVITQEIFIRPNPARDEILLSTDEDLLGSLIEVYTAAGVKTLEAPYCERLSVSMLPPGVYFLRAGNRIGKFVKE
ncbi:MAG: hypothetical protein ACM3U1_09110 [Chloroflexota bacterium]